MRSRNSGLTVAQALALGALQGPAELLPISSSAHTIAVPWLLGWRYDELEPQLRKSFEVGLHAGSAVGAAVGLRNQLGRGMHALDWPQLRLLILANAPPAVTGYLLEAEIERRLGTPRTIALALITGGLVMILADRQPAQRHRGDAQTVDGLWLGAAQAAALIPGISRAGATLVAARFRCFRRADATLLSDQVGLPVLAGATLLRLLGLRRLALDGRGASLLLAGTGASVASTLAGAAFLRGDEHARRLTPYGLYRLALGGWMLMRLRRGSRAGCPGPARS